MVQARDVKVREPSKSDETKHETCSGIASEMTWAFSKGLTRKYYPYTPWMLS